MKILIIFIICSIFALNTFGQRFETASEGMSEENFYSQKTASGYEYFDSNDNLIGHSESDGYGGYNYYDASGSKIGSIQPDEEENYIIYDAQNVEIGILEALPSKKYRHRPSFEGGFREFDVRPSDEEDIGTLNPFQLFE